MYLENIKEPSDLKKLTIDQRYILAQEMRRTLINYCSVRGGHLAPNLGVVELTIALHTVFDSPKDKIIFDVSHQSYCHKMLTGRVKNYLFPESEKTLSGFTCPKESVHDHFTLGHTSSSIGLACGLAKRRDVANTKDNIVVIIGDGAVGGGVAFEGLNTAGELNSNIIIILNDNDMSVAENHGSLYSNIQLLRESNGTAPCNFFKSLGFDYRFLKDGNNLEKITKILQELKDIDHPVLLHLCTKKGKGYGPAEKDPEKWHWCPPFDVKTGISTREHCQESYDCITADFLSKKMRDDPSIFTLMAGNPTIIEFTKEKRKKAGDQFIDVGIAEECAMLVASGIAKSGGKPVFVDDATFIQRAIDQLEQEVCIDSIPITLIIRNASILGYHNVTHLGFFDIPLLSNIPNLVYMAPTNKEEYLAMLEWSIDQQKYPVAIRMPKNEVHHAKEQVKANFEDVNKYSVMQKGQRIAIIALGSLYQLGENVAKKIAEVIGISPTLINPRFITGLDVTLLEKLKVSHDIVLTLEDGVIEGGFGEKISRYYCTDHAIRVYNYGLKKKYLDMYMSPDVFRANRLTVEQIVEDVLSLITK